MLFGRDKTSAPPASQVTSDPPKEGGKGHATPTRKQAEAAKRRPLVPQTRTKGTSKENRAAARTQAREQRDIEYRAMQTGDEANMPVQHRGPVRRYVRDAVDSRRTLAEFFLPVLFVLMLAAMIASGHTSPSIAVTLMAMPYVYLLLAAIDTVVRWRRLRPVLTRKFGKDGLNRGTLLYFITRTIQIRRLRAPRPQIKPGELPR